MDKVQARRIAEKFASGICTAEEHEALFAWLLSLPISESSALMEEFSGIFERLEAVPEHRDLWNRISEGLEESANIVAPMGLIAQHSPARSMRIWMVAAASVSILFTAGVFFFTQKKPVRAIVLQSRQDVAPGGNKATLTLANGTVIVLDSLKDGQLALQGKTKVIKLDNGRLAYHSETGAGAADGDAESFNVVTTPKGGQYQLILADGSKVWLNSASSLRFPTVFRGKKRSVELSGEGYFEIEKNVEMPFMVSVDRMQVKVLGTRFDVMAYKDEKTINTTLLQGAVSVDEGNLAKQLVPGEQAVLDGPASKLDIVQADIQKVIAWKNGVFEFDNTDMPTIMRQLSRWYDIDVQYKVQPGMPDLGGSISKKLNLSQVLNLLEKNGINHFRIEGKKVTVLP